MVPSDDAPVARLAEMLVHLARSACAAEGTAPALTAAQWSALRYFAAAQQPSCTPSAFARFHGASRGTASQTVKALVGAGLLERHASASDRRSARFALTEAGLTALANDPLHRLVAAIETLPEASRSALQAAAVRLVWAVDAARGAPTFGLCRDCGHYRCTPRDGGWCERHAMALGTEDMARLCGDFAPREAAAPSIPVSGDAP